MLVKAYGCVSNCMSCHVFHTITGAGQMAEALAKGWSTAGVLQPSQMCAFDINEERLAVFQAMGIQPKKTTLEVR